MMFEYLSIKIILQVVTNSCNSVLQYPSWDIVHIGSIGCHLL